jgi:dihydroorotate dehydrogenase
LWGLLGELDKAHRLVGILTEGIMIIRDRDYGRVMNASGARGFFGKDYWHSKLINWGDTPFVTKTCTLNETKGNMALTNDYTPKKLWPDCIYIDFVKGIMLNAVGLSNPGYLALARENRWDEEAVISIKLNEEEVDQFVREYGRPNPLQLNWSCPNNRRDENRKIFKVLDGLEPLDRTLFVKLSMLEETQFLLEVADHPAVDCLVIGNTIPFNHPSIEWSKWVKGNPLEKYGGGGLSGKPLVDLCWQAVRKVRDKGYRGPLVAGGGVLGWWDSVSLLTGGADAVEIGSGCVLRPWQVNKVIRKLTHEYHATVSA